MNRVRGARLRGKWFTWVSGGKHFVLDCCTWGLPNFVCKTMGSQDLNVSIGNISTPSSSGAGWHLLFAIACAENDNDGLLLAIPSQQTMLARF